MPNKGLPFADIVQHVPKVPEHQVRINHTNCPEGEDTRGRLYVVLRNTGKIEAYCHNCQRGFVGKRNRKINEPKDEYTKADEPKNEIYIKPTYTPYEPEDEVHPWLRQYGITIDEAVTYRIGVNHRDNVTIPVIWSIGWVGHLERNTEGYEWMPKWLAKPDKQRLDGRRLMFPCLQRRGGTVVLVEDAISAIKVSRVTDAVAVLTATVDKQTLVDLATIYDKCIVFFDNDNQLVRKEQRRIKQQGSLIFKEGVRVIKASKDPKEHSTEELKELLDD